MDIAIYIRVSTLDQAREGYSLAAQEKTLKDWCERWGHTVYKVYADEGISGKDISHRPAIKAMLEDAKNHKFDAILIWALSRFTRSVADLYSTWDMLNKHKVALISATESFDTSTPTGRAMMGMLGIFAQMEREITGERVSLAIQERVRQGKRTCNYALGYDPVGKDDLKVNDREAETVKLIYDKYCAYQCLLAVSDCLNALGYKGKNNKNFTAEGVKKILSNPLYIGYYRYKGELYAGNYDPIIDRITWDKVQRILRKNAKGKNRIR